MNSCDLVRSASRPKLSLPLSVILFALFPPASCYCPQILCSAFFMFINLLSTSSTTHPEPYRPGDHFICLFIPVFPFHYLSNFSSSSQTINQSPPARCKPSISPHLYTSFLHSLICMLVSFYILCLLSLFINSSSLFVSSVAVCGI